MYGGFGRGRTAGADTRGGMGLGFRGSSPPWPYVERGRGGLPRCGYLAETPAVAGSVPGAASMTREDELNYLKSQVQAVKDNLERINTRVQNLESEK